MDERTVPNNELDWFIFQLRKDAMSSDPVLKISGIENIGFDVEQVTWGIQLGFLGETAPYVRVDSYFEAWTGKHIATHFGEHVIIKVGAKQMTIEIHNLVASRRGKNHSYDLSGLNYLDVA